MRFTLRGTFAVVVVVMGGGDSVVEFSTALTSLAATLWSVPSSGDITVSEQTEEIIVGRMRRGFPVGLPAWPAGPIIWPVALFTLVPEGLMFACGPVGQLRGGGELEARLRSLEPEQFVTGWIS